jgi:hypothetical protein
MYGVAADVYGVGVNNRTPPVLLVPGAATALAAIPIAKQATISTLARRIYATPP